MQLLCLSLAIAIVISSHMVVNALNINMATITVFGASGKTGSEFVYQALNAGYKVVALARTPSKVVIPEGSGGSDANKPFNNPNLHIIQGDVTNQSDCDKIFNAAGDDCIGCVVSLGGKTKDVGATMLTVGTTNIVNSMKKLTPKAKRISIVTSIGAGDSEKQAPFAFRALMYTVMKNIFVDKNNQEKLFLDANSLGSDLDFCIVRPGGLGIGAPTGVINVIDGQAGSIQRADVATFLLGAITDKSFPYLKKTPCISSVSGTGWRKEPKAGFDDVNTA